ncbi:hypothetical protein VTL71DRAFT_12294 [Oculimacula yallundae]|uniref:2EXR domain-containing protein n=1 Tax=Oculimacula yallundae TaxID=86028 RepID=A0ABR4CPT5_9HELO
MDTPTFHLFPELPIEIRLDVYTLAASHPSIITFNEPLMEGEEALMGGEVLAGLPELCRRQSQVHITPHRMQSLLHVNHESRAIALQNYILGFGKPGTKQGDDACWPSPSEEPNDEFPPVFRVRGDRCQHSNAILRDAPDVSTGIPPWILYIISSCLQSLLVAIRGILSVSLWPHRHYHRYVLSLASRSTEICGEGSFRGHMVWEVVRSGNEILQSTGKTPIPPISAALFKLKLVGCVGNDLHVRDIEKAVDWVEDITGIWSLEDFTFKTERYGNPGISLFSGSGVPPATWLGGMYSVIRYDSASGVFYPLNHWVYLTRLHRLASIMNGVADSIYRQRCSCSRFCPWLEQPRIESPSMPASVKPCHLFWCPNCECRDPFSVVRSVIWEDFNQNFSLLLAESVSTIDMLSTIFPGRMLVFLASGIVPLHW